VQFDPVSNASGYIVSLDVGIGISRRIEKAEVVRFETENMTDGKAYTLSIVSVGEGDYTDSDTYKLNFTYLRPEEHYTFLLERNMRVEDFIEYLKQFGLSEEQLRGVEGDEVCEGDEATVLWSSIDGKTLTKSELLNGEIEYTYCRIEDNEEEKE
jgi:hypothetical protein